MKTIKSSSEITNIFEHGRRIGVSDFSLIVLRNDNQHDLDGRVAFIAGKKNGNAVWRNRAKRRMRALCFEAGGAFPGYDVIFLARKTVTEAPFDKMSARLKAALSKAGIAADRDGTN